MDHSGHDMGSMMPTATAMSAMPSSTGMAGHSSMDMGGGQCKISMMWNWFTIDSCFIAKSWHVRSKGMFAGSCIGVILLVIVLEFLRRAGKEYDRYIVKQFKDKLAPAGAFASSSSSDNGANKALSAVAGPAYVPSTKKFRPSILQQAIRALLHMAQFAVAYFIMLLAMYYNGYIIICIFIGAYLGFFIFGWESFGVGQGGNDRMQENVTVCCG